MAKRARILFVIVLIVTVSQSGAALADCLHWNVGGTSLEGDLRLHRFPGPPNYEDVATGDTEEEYFVLHLKQPVCVNGEDDIQGAITERDVLVVQLLVPESKRESLRNKIGKTIAVRGKLFARHTGHHHTAVLVEIE
jgi:hypothetical protein